MKISFIKPIQFGYKSILKDEWRSNPEMQEHVKFGLYGGRLTEQNITFEHIRPASKGGTTDIFNGALATKKTNEARGNRPLASVLNKEMFERYIAQFKGWCATLFNNEEYIKRLTKTVEKQGIKLK